MSTASPSHTVDSSGWFTPPADDRQFQESSVDRTAPNDLTILRQSVANDGHVLPHGLGGGGGNEFFEWTRTNGELASPANKISIPLRSWADSEERKSKCLLNDSSAHSRLMIQRTSVVRKLKVAFALGKLLSHLKDSVSSYSKEELLQLCSVDNFTVEVSVNGADNACLEVMGVAIISPPLSLQIITNHSADDESSCAHDDEFGNVVKTVITRHSSFCCAKLAAQGKSNNELSICYVLGVLLRFIFFESSADSVANISGNNPQELNGHNDMLDNFLRSLSISPDSIDLGNTSYQTEPSYRPTKFTRMSPQRHDELNAFHSLAAGAVSQLVAELLDCERRESAEDEEHPPVSLDLVNDDMYALLLAPTRFLFEPNNQLSSSTKMYGRASEAKALLDGFTRVARSGRSEVSMVKGFSGSGKTRLVQSVFGSVIAANGLIVTKKFEESSTNQLSITLSLFNDLCTLLLERYCFINGGTTPLWHQLLSEFDQNFPLLVGIIPNLIKLAPSPVASFSLGREVAVDNVGDVNYFSLCDMIKRFMRAISISSYPVVFYLDDLQWADPVSMGLIHTVLSDIKGSSCVFFIGSYRDNEVSESHILHGFYGWLAAFNVPVNTVHLRGMSEREVNSLVSDSLGMLPRTCQYLSRVVYRKTEGNPFFVQTFLRSLVDKRILTYSPRERRWKWDIEVIYAENITPNVLDLLSAKMAHLSESSQNALKIASCFGFKVDVSIINQMSKSPQYASLTDDLNNAVDAGLMNYIVNSEGACFTFVHDKVREAASEMISSDSRRKNHFDIGIALLSNFDQRQNEERSHIMFVILDQINHGVPALLVNESQRLSIAELNYKAASKMLHSYNYTSAYHLSKTAISLLPDDSWNMHYNLSLQSHLLLSKAAYSYRKVEEAKDALNIVVKYAKTLDTKLDAYTLLHSILFSVCAPEEMGQLLITMIEMLGSFGEEVRYEDVSQSEITTQINSVVASFNQESDDVLMLHMYTSSSSNHTAIMQAYNILVNLAYVAKPKLYAYFVSRWAQFFLKNKVACIHTPAVYVTFALVLCQDMSSDNIKVGYRIGKLGLKVLKQHSSISELPAVHLLYYGHVGILFEPMQACIDMHRRAYDISMQIGNNSIAALHKQFLTVRQLLAGTNLLDLKEELEHEIKMTDQYYSFPVLGMKLKLNYNTVLNLIGDTTSNLFQESDLDVDTSTYDNESTHAFHLMITLTYRGYHSRVIHNVKRWELSSGENDSKKMISFRAVYVCFCYGLALIGLKRQKTSKAARVKESLKHWLEVVENAAKCSKWNFENKACLLRAERFSLAHSNQVAEEEYANAIKASQSSHFIHEEGLANELAGCHYERLGNASRALELFSSAKNCYEMWGSIVKYRQMEEKMKKLSPADDVCS